MNWEKSDFGKLRVNVVSMERDRNCLKESDWLASIFHPFAEDDDLNNLKGITLNNLVRVVVICYDPKSPLVTRIDDVRQRKIEAFKIFETRTYKDGRFSEDVDKIILGKNEKFNRMVLQYLKAIDNMAFASMYLFAENYYDMLYQLATQDNKERAQTMVMIAKIEEIMKKKASEFYSGDDDLINYTASEKIYEEAKAITPELMAKKLAAMKDKAND